MQTGDPNEPKATPRDTAESEEQEVWERAAAERGPSERARELDDPREDEGWSQPESSAQKGAVRDDGWSSG